jgi:hypothetical protein
MSDIYEIPVPFVVNDAPATGFRTLDLPLKVRVPSAAVKRYPCSEVLIC